MLSRALAVGTIALALACNTDKTPPAERPPEKAPANPVDAPPPADVDAPKGPKTADADCLGPETTGAVETHTWNGITWEQNGSTVSWTGPERDKVIVGAVTDIKESSPENLENLKAFVAWFKKTKVDLIIVDGDSGTTREGIETAIDTLAKAEVPVFVIIGNGEGRADYNAAIAAVRGRSPQVFDLGKVRRVHTPQADFVSLPGYFNPSFIHAKDGCQYFPADVEATAAIIRNAKAPVVLVTHGGPQQSGMYAVDRTTEGNFVGDPALTQLLKEQKVPFGIFGNIHEAGGHATDIDGVKLIPQKIPVDSLYLNPGPSDAVTWLMNDKSESVGMAAILTIAGGKASYEIHRRGPVKPMKKGK